MKKIVVLFTVIMLVVSFACSSVFASGLLSFGDEIGAENFTAKLQHGFDVFQNEKYVFVAEGKSIAAFTNPDVRVTDRIHIYEKPNEEHFDYKFLTTVEEPSNTSSMGLPLGGGGVYDDVLFASWGINIYSKTDHGGYAITDSKVSPVRAYDIADLAEKVENGESPKKYRITSDNTQRDRNDHAPFIRGNMAYLDEETGKFYIGFVERSTYLRHSYRVVDASSVAGYLREGSSVAAKTFSTGKNSRNAVMFIVKDGYLFEVLQQKKGLVDLNIANSLVDSEGSKLNNCIHIYDVATAEEKVTSSYGSIESYRRGTYITELEGDATISDIAVSGNYMYLATLEGVEVVNIADAKTASGDTSLYLEQKLLEGEEIKGIEAFDDKLYVGTTGAMYIYDISQSEPSLILNMDYEGGFSDFDVNVDENMLYAMSATNKGVLVIDVDFNETKLNAKDFKFTLDDAETTKVSEGNFGFNVKIENEKEATTFMSVLSVYKNGKLYDVSKKEWTVEKEASLDVSDALNVPQGEDYYAKVLFTKADNINKVIPLLENGALIFEKELGEYSSLSEISDNSADMSEIDKEGKVVVSGTLADYKNKPVLAVIENTSAEGEQLSYIDVVNVSADGKYSLTFVPGDSGEYKVTLSKPLGYGKISKTTEVSEALVTIENSVEIPGVNAFLYVSIENGQNIDVLDFEMDYDGDVFTAGTNLETSDKFEVSDVTNENGKLKARFTKKGDLTTDSHEFCIIPIEVKDSAQLSDYDLILSASGKDEFSKSINVSAQNGLLQVVENTPKYGAIADAKEALNKLKKADEIKVDDYLDEKVKVEDARAKVEIAYEYFVRDSQLGTDLLDNLKNAEIRIAEITPYYDAVGKLNDADSENVINTLKELNEFFEVEEDALSYYDDLEDKSKLEDVMAETTFNKPSDVYKKFYEQLLLSAFSETKWQKIDTLLLFSKRVPHLDCASYDNLNATQKAEVQKELALREFASISDIQNALDNAVRNAKNTVSGSGSGASSSRPSGSGSKGSNNQSVYLPNAPVATATPATPAPIEPQDKSFKDIENCKWAEEAINYLYNNNVISGKTAGIYAPFDNVKREEFAKMVVLAFGLDSFKGNVSFDDVSENVWYTDYVVALKEAGIVYGRPDGTFGVGDYITREEIAVILDRIFKLKGIELKETTKAEFEDVNEISDYAISAINKMCSSGILNGFEDGTVKPQALATRAQTAQLIYKALMQLI